MRFPLQGRHRRRYRCRAAGRARQAPPSGMGAVEHLHADQPGSPAHVAMVMTGLPGGAEDFDPRGSRRRSSGSR